MAVSVLRVLFFYLHLIPSLNPLAAEKQHKTQLIVPPALETYI